jgi:hypothetical protein
MNCNSTHGGAGYASGSYWDGEDIICGECGYRITNPRPTGGRIIYKKGIRGWWGQIDHVEPRWPSFILGKRGKKFNA